MSEESTRRAAARCTDCGNVFPVKVREDGSLRPIGNDGRCPCGNDAFRRIDPEETVPDEG